MDIVTLGAALNGSAEYVNSHFKGGSNIQIVNNPDGTQTINASGEVSSEDTVARAEIAAIKDGEKLDSFGDVETALSDKADTSTTYTKIEVDTVLSGKVDKETGKGLSTNDYTDAEKTKLAGIEAQANKTTVDDALDGSSTNPVQNKVIKSALDGKADTSTTYTKTEVDTALNSKQNTISDLSTIRSGAALGATAVQPEAGKGLSTNDYTTAEKTKLDSLVEIKTIGTGLELDDNGELTATGGGSGGTTNYNDLSNKPQINGNTLSGNKTSTQLGLASASDIPTTLAELSGDTTHRVVTDDEKAIWNNKSDFSGSYNDLTDKPTIPDKLSDLTEDATHRTVTDTEKATWNAKADVADIPTVPVKGIKKNNAVITPDASGVVNITVPTSATDVSALPDTTKYAAALSLTINSSTFVMTGQLKDQDGNNLGTVQTIDLPLESVVVGGSYNSQTKKVVLTLQNGNTIEFSVADLVSGLQTELSASNKLNPAYINYDSTHRAVSDTEKSTWNGKQSALSTSQLAAVNSGATTTKIDQIDINKNNILSILTPTVGGITYNTDLTITPENVTILQSGKTVYISICVDVGEVLTPDTTVNIGTLTGVSPPNLLYRGICMASQYLYSVDFKQCFLGIATNGNVYVRTTSDITTQKFIINATYIVS